MKDVPDPLFRLDDFIPALREIVRERPFDATRWLHVAVPVKDPAKHSTPVPAGIDRQSILFTDGTEVWSWEVDSLRALFRGNKQPPVLGDYPTAYNDAFAILDLHTLEISNLFGDRRDAEMREIYSALRRRPDGRSLGFVHDYLWQAAALVLGTRPLSQAEFEAIMERLERSCRTFELGSTSRNYVSSLRQIFGQTKPSAKPSGPNLEDAVDRLLQRIESGEGSCVEPELSALYAKHPRHYLTNYAMGTYQAMVAKDAHSAASYFETAVQLRPDFAEAHFNLGSAAKQKGDILKAVESFRRAEQHSDGEDGIAEMARNAIRRLEEIILKTAPFRSLDAFLDSARLFNRAYDCLAARQFEQAINLFQRVLAGDPKHVQSYGNMALAHAGLGRRSEAMACFDRALELDPKYEPARLNRQRLAHMREGEPFLPEAILQVDFYADQHRQSRG